MIENTLRWSINNIVDVGVFGEVLIEVDSEVVDLLLPKQSELSEKKREQIPLLCPQAAAAAPSG